MNSKIVAIGILCYVAVASPAVAQSASANGAGAQALRSEVARDAAQDRTAGQPPLDTTPAPWPDQERELRASGALDSVNSREARQTMAAFAACVAAVSPDKVADVLNRDFRTTTYRNGLRNLSSANESCARKVGLRGSLRMANLPFAAALAEVMLKRDPAPLNARLARAAAGPEVATFAPSDAMAMCVARSVPDDVASLLRSEPGSPDETAALGKVEKVATLCARGTKLEISPLGLRSIIATASYRLVASQQS